MTEKIFNRFAACILHRSVSDLRSLIPENYEIQQINSMIKINTCRDVSQVLYVHECSIVVNLIIGNIPSVTVLGGTKLHEHR